MTTVSASGCRPRTAAKFWRAAAAREDTNSLSRTNAQPADNRFRRKHRLADVGLIARAVRYGRSRRSQHFALYTLKTRAAPTQFCFRTPRRLGNAPKRNRVRRLLREFVRTHKELWQPDCAVVIDALAGATELSLAEVTAQLEPLFRDE